MAESKPLIARVTVIADVDKDMVNKLDEAIGNLNVAYAAFIDAASKVKQATYGVANNINLERKPADG